MLVQRFKKIVLDEGELDGLQRGEVLHVGELELEILCNADTADVGEAPKPLAKAHEDMEADFGKVGRVKRDDKSYPGKPGELGEEKAHYLQLLKKLDLHKTGRRVSGGDDLRDAFTELGRVVEKRGEGVVMVVEPTIEAANRALNRKILYDTTVKTGPRVIGFTTTTPLDPGQQALFESIIGLPLQQQRGGEEG